MEKQWQQNQKQQIALARFLNVIRQPFLLGEMEEGQGLAV